MIFKNKGNFQQSIEELENNKNNAIAQVFKNKNNKKGKLENVVFTLKNNYAKKFDLTDASSNLLTNFNASYNATILDKLFNEGAILVATTNLDEFGLGGTGQFSNRGIIYHPQNQDYYVGGSSSGCAATFTKNIGFSIGSDTGDSVRLPSSNIGKVGFKPSYGCVSRYGLFAYASSLDTVSWFTHNVNDSICIANVLYGEDKKDLTSLDLKLSENIMKSKPKKIAYLNCFNFLENYVLDEYKKLLDKLKNNNIELVEIKPDLDLLNAIKIVYEIISFSEASSNLSNLTGVSFGKRIEGSDWEETFLKTRSDGFGLMVQKRLALGSYYLEKGNQEEYFIRAQKVRRLIHDWFNKIYDNYDLLIFPSSPRIARKVKEEKTVDYGFMSNILTASNLVGNPSICMKLGTFNNMPFNISLESKIYNDEKLFSYALFFEELLGVNND